MYEEAAACEDKDVEEVKSAHLTASFLPKLKSDRCFLPFSRLTRDIFRRSFWRGDFYLFRIWHRLDFNMRFAMRDFTKLSLTSPDFRVGCLPRGFCPFRFWHLLYYLKVTWHAGISKLPSDMAESAFAPEKNDTGDIWQLCDRNWVGSLPVRRMWMCKEWHTCGRPIASLHTGLL